MAPKTGQPMVQCARAGCAGTCPLRVVVAGAGRLGAPAKCRTCGSAFKAPPGGQGILDAIKQGQRGSNGAAAQAGTAKGKYQGARGKATGTGRQNQQQQSPTHSDNSKQRDDEALRKEHEELRRKLQLAETAAKAPEDETAMDAEDGGDGLADAVQHARKRFNEFRNMPEAIHDLVAGGYESGLAKLQSDLSSAQAARRAANPLDKQLEGAEAFKARMLEKVEKAKKAVAETEQEQLAILAQLEEKHNALEEAEAAVKRATAEVASLAARCAAERNATAAPTGEPAAGAKDPPEGFVSIAFAEEKWAEREEALSLQLAELRAMVASQADSSAAPTEAAPSMASDVGAVEDVEDDEKWSKVAKDNRHALLRKQKEELATKVRSKLKAVTTVRSPFLKR